MVLISMTRQTVRRLVRVLCSLSLLITGLMFGGPVESAFQGYNGKIIFASTRDANFEIYSMNGDGSSQTNLSSSPGSSDLHPDVSADGTKIAFTSDRAGTYDVYVMNVDGTGAAPVASGPGYELYPAWSPDGARLAYIGFDGSNFEIFVTNLDGTSVVNISNDPGYDLAPAWSPDGTKIAFSSTRTGDFRLHVVDLTTLAVSQVTGVGGVQSADWSPDGTRLVFDAAGDIHTVNADGTGLTNVTSSPSFEEYPAWSPDGTTLLYGSNVSGNMDLYAQTLSGAAVQLTSGAGANTLPSWQPRFSNGDAAASVVLNGPVASKSGKKRFSVDVVNVGTDPVSFSAVTIAVQLNGADAPGSVSPVSGSLPVTLAPGESVRLAYEWSFPKGSVSSGSTVVVNASLSNLDGDVNAANNSGSGSTSTV